MKAKVWNWPEFLIGAFGVGTIAVLLWPREATAMPPLGPVVAQAHTFDVEMVPGKTIILRVAVGDTINLSAPSGWGPPSANANVPGFLQIQSTDTSTDLTSLKVIDGGQGQISMTAGGETAIVSIEVL
jgi:hypothetical protein